MTTLLHIDASPRGERSPSSLFVPTIRRRPADAASGRCCDRARCQRQPPPFIDEQWIGGRVHGAGAAHGRDSRPAPRASDELIDELAAADVIALGVPMHNYGMPAALKARLDNVMRIDRTFDVRSLRAATTRSRPIPRRQDACGAVPARRIRLRAQAAHAPARTSFDPHLQSVAPISA